MATYVGNSPEDILKTRRRNYYYTATSSQTTFTGADDNGTVLNVNESDLEVFMNGVLLDQSDYTANTTHIVLSTAAATDDILEIQTFNDYFVDSNLSRFGGNVSGNLNLRDNIKLNFGASDDLQIYHTGSTSYIFEQGTGDLRIRGSEVRIEDGDGSTIALFREDQGAQLRYNGDIKLESTNTGVDVTGTVISDNYQVNGTNNSFPADTGNPQILGTSNGGTFPFNESGSLVYRARLNNTDGRSNHYFYTGSTPLLRQNIKANGDISFYADDGTTQGFFWDASTQRLGIGTSSPSSQLHLSSALPRIYLTDTDTSTTSFLIGDNGWLTFSADTSRIVFNINSSEVMRMLENGNVGIGTSSPAHLLDLLNSGSGDATIQVKSTTAGDPTLLFDSAAANRNAVIKFMDQGSFVGGRIQYVHLDDRMDFQAGSSIGSTMSIKNGSVGIGTASPAVKLVVQNDSSTAFNPSTAAFNTVATLKNTTGGASTNALLSFATEANGEWYIGGVQNSSNTAADFVFTSRNSGTRAERMRITAAGVVGIGTSDISDARLSIFGSGVNNFNAIQIRKHNEANISNGGIISFAQYDDASTSWTNLGGWDTGSDRIIYLGGGSWGPQEATELRVYTGSYDAGSGGAPERMRITSAGAMTMGTATSLTAVSGITLKNDVQGGYPTLLFLQNQPGTGGTMGADIQMGYASDYGSILRFYGNPFSTRPGGFQFRRVTGSGTSDLSMQIGTDGALNVQGVYDQTTGSGANVNVASDGQLRRSTSSLRYKNTVNNATHGLTELLTLRPVTYKGNNDGDTIFGGLIVEEVHDAGLTEFVQYNDDGEPDALAYGNMVSLCIKAIQELKAENDQLKARLDAAGL